MSKGGGSKAPTEQTVNQVNLPEYAEPYVTRLFQRAENESLQPYQPYDAQRLAEWTPQQLTAFGGYEQAAMQGAPQQLNQASSLAYGAGLASQFGGPSSFGYSNSFLPNTVSSYYSPGNITSGYAPSQYGSSYQADLRFDPNTSAPALAGGSGYNPYAAQSQYAAGQLNPWMQMGPYGGSIYNPNSSVSQFAPQGRTSSYTAGQYSPGYQAGMFAGQYDPTGRMYSSMYSGEDGQVDANFGAERWIDPTNTQDYMNPYQQQVVNAQKAEATRRYEQDKQGLSLDAAQTGNVGGYREGIMQAELQRNLNTQLNDIQAQGDLTAWQEGRDQFNKDQAMRFQGAQLGLEADMFSAGQGAQAEQLRQSAWQMGEQARQNAMSLGMSAFEANQAAQQAQEQFFQSAFGMNQQNRQAQEQLGLANYQTVTDFLAQQEQLRQGAYGQTQDAFQNAEQLRQGAYGQDLQSLIGQEQLRQSLFGQNEQMRQAQAELGLNAYGQTQQSFQQAEALRQAALAGDNNALAQYEQLMQSQWGQNQQNMQQQEALNQNAYSIYQQALQSANAQGLDAQQAQEAAMQRANDFLMQAQQFNVGSQFNYANLGMQGLSQDAQNYYAGLANQLQSAGQLGTLGAMDQQMLYDRLGQLRTVGEQQQQYNQIMLDTAYQDYLNQVAYPRQQLSFYNSLLRGLTPQVGTTTTSYMPQPSGLQSALATGLGAMGLYNTLGGSGYTPPTQ